MRFVGMIDPQTLWTITAFIHTHKTLVKDHCKGCAHNKPLTHMIFVHSKGNNTHHNHKSHHKHTATQQTKPTRESRYTPRPAQPRAVVYLSCPSPQCLRALTPEHMAAGDRRNAACKYHRMPVTRQHPPARHDIHNAHTRCPQATPRQPTHPGVT